MKKSTARKIPILDIPGLSSFQHLHGNTPELILQGTRVVCMFDSDEVFYALSARYNDNETVSVLDFCNAQRQLKAKMYSLKNGGHS